MTSLFFIEIVQDIRQFFYPEPLRIHKIKPLSKPSEEIEQLLEQLRSATLESKNAVELFDPKEEQGKTADLKFMADLATRLWRIRAGLVVPGSDAPYKNVSRSFRYLERLIDMLEKQNIRIIDKTGDFYDPGMMMEVITSEPMKGIPRDIIKETLEPMIMKEDRIIQTAKVVVGIPLEPDNKES